MQLEQLLNILGYSQSENYHLVEGQHSPSTAAIFRAASRAGAIGAYVIHSSENDEILPVRPAIYVAEAPTPEKARDIHRKLWNSGNAPFLIVLLPGQIRIYTGFDFDAHNERRGLIDSLDLMGSLLDSVEETLNERLKDFHAESVDTGDLWRSQAANLDPNRRVDKRLLKNLRKLEKVLVEENLKAAGPDAPKFAHAIIGKYVYIRYLRDRDILSDDWLAERGIDIDEVLGRDAKLKGLNKLIKALQDRFNGAIFPFPAKAREYLTDDVISLVARAFKGDDPELRQLHLDFEPYDFSYIPIELLSSIYEQFLHAQGEGRKVGAYYTPELLADYLLYELNSVKPLKKGMKILDACCGSGIFLVLTYRRMIEMELHDSPEGKLSPEQLSAILENIYGVERNLEACYVTEFSLILMLLNYLTPPDLHQNEDFHFPELHNKQIFECDFFDEHSLFLSWIRERFNWIIGNPPWIEIKADTEGEGPAKRWISRNRYRWPIARNRTSEAFSWRVTEFLADDGYIGLLLHAKSLHNNMSEEYRKAFFKQNKVARITNFSNMRHVLFGGRVHAPAATFIYTKAKRDEEKHPIIHYGPFVASQVPSRAWAEVGRSNAWGVTINENEIKAIEHEEAEGGDGALWKLALWGNHRDKKALEELRRIFITTLKDVTKERGWHLSEGVQLRECLGKSSRDLEALPEVQGMRRVDIDALNNSGRRFLTPQSALKKIPPEECFVRRRGGKGGLELRRAPHLVLNPNYAVFSEQNFVIPSGQVGLSAPKADADHLRSISALCGSSVVQYYLFFTSPQLGIDRSRITLEVFEDLPLPQFTETQISELAELHGDLAEAETDMSATPAELQSRLDRRVERILNIPGELSTIAREFLRIRSSLDQGSVTGVAMRQPNKAALEAYAQCLRDELNEFAEDTGIGHKVTVVHGRDLTVCSVELIKTDQPMEVNVERADGNLSTSMDKIQKIRERAFSQWVYIKSNVRQFDRSEVTICKNSRLIDWTKTEALVDSDDIIAEAISFSELGGTGITG